MPIDFYQRKQLAAAIQRDIDAFSLTYDDGHRPHLGASLIGNPCRRYLWYGFRWMFHKVHEPRMYRLFQRGHREEATMWAMLRACGWTILDTDPATGKQWRVSALNGHFGGSLDAVGYPPPSYGINEWVMLECKTNKDGESSAKWNALERKGMEVEKPQHWAQACTYGYLKQIGLVVYLAVNKDDDRLHIEVLPLDWEHGKNMVDKGEFVILSNTPPPRIHDNPSHFDCKYCDARQLCWGKDVVQRNCRSCVFAIPGENKSWYCTGFNATIPDDIIKVGCANWKELLR